MIEDSQILGQYYPDYFMKGISYPNFMSYGVFDSYVDSDITFVKPGVIIDGSLRQFDPQKITEQVQYAWYKNDQGAPEVDLSKSDAYTFIKAPRYDGLPMEVGPLARLIVSGNYTGGHSCMDRIIARTLETDIIANIIDNLAHRVEPLPNNQRAYEIPQQASGAGFIDTTRGALGHWVQIENHVINHYNIITPTVWNLSPKDQAGTPGVIERALLESTISNIDEPVEIGRIVRSFDPCVSCATHLLGKDGEEKSIELLI
jgi:hydrogenase large subunit